MSSIDIYSITNPALSSLLLWSFVQGYERIEKSGCPFPLLYLPLPLVLSKSIRDEFKGTNADTGLYTWITRKPNVLVDLKVRIEKTSILTRNAIVFSCSSEVLTILDTGTVTSNSKGIVKSRINNISDEINEMLKSSKRLGIWFAQLNSPANIFNSLGLTL
jgi:hypothetical protein